MIQGERNTLLAVVAASVASLSLAALSALYLDRVLGAALRGTDWDFLLFPGVAILVVGHGWVWYWIYCKTLDWLDKHL